ncbi:MAG TPA: SDR family NAD(P)-dependent oxidoreductase [Alteraurantiacibacter sp.]
MKDLQGKTAFITGSGAGMGLGMAYAFGRAGMKVMISDIRPDVLEEALAGLQAEGIEADSIVLDVADRNAMAEAARKTVERFGSVDIAIANAAAMMIGRVRDGSFDDWDWTNSVNIGGVINLIQSFLPILREQGSGHIVATASMAGISRVPHGGLYSVQKAAVVAIMESLAAELANENVGVSVICPGLTKSGGGGAANLRPEKFAEHGVKFQMPAPPQNADPDAPPPPSPMDFAMDWMELGERVLAGIKAGDLFILTHSEFGDQIREEFAPILAAMDGDNPAPRLPPEEAAAGKAPPGMDFGLYARELVRKKAAAQ